MVHPISCVCCAGCIQELSLDGTGSLDFSAGPGGQEPIRLDPAIFCNLKKLWMRSDLQIRMHIPAAVHLTSLQIYVHVLVLSFEDAMVSCANLTELIMLYQTTRGPLFDQLLSEALAKNGLQLHKHLSASLQTQGYCAFVTCIPSKFKTIIHTDNQEFRQHLETFQGALGTCNCKICWPCMRLGGYRLD